MVSRETAGPPSGRPAGPAPEAPPVLPSWLEKHRSALEAYAELLADAGVTRGLIGPREVPRLWERHLLNCAVVADPASGAVPAGAQVADVGTGAGLPGLVWAIVRPDLSVVLIEPLLRRSTFLTEAVIALDLTAQVAVWRGRAEEARPDGSRSPGEQAGALPLMDVVTARAVAPLDRLVGWTAPLLKPGGRLVALKGSSAAAELTEHADAVAAAGIVGVEVREYGAGVVDPPTTVILGTRRTAQ